MVPDKNIDAPALDEKDVALFISLCQFVWVQGEPLPLIYDVQHPIYARQGINLPVLKYLQAIGLISLEAAGYVKRKFGKHTRLFYFGRPTKIQFPREANNQLDLGHVLLTAKGKALVAFCDAKRNQEFYEYVIERWCREGLVVSSILKRP
ncbi:DUF2806 domain-containing protein [Nitrosovibrio sp. Nv6]|uniref:DUF2806 domain-containing protein n=1 Tax=Nitrosovibrio sp. Nv6 TaxID=1855340 RepID=UPI0008C64469|nr:DUF2806 domain-containing protein [Nitrosovibrio sp. Nv6]SEP29754.1 Protein of unknown function [Nitrosovibrio sp. Nv6]